MEVAEMVVVLMFSGFSHIMMVNMNEKEILEIEEEMERLYCPYHAQSIPGSTFVI